MAETSTILKYRRPQDSWLCPECDSENTLSYSTCSVCGCGIVGAPKIVKAWSLLDDRPSPYGRPTYVNPGVALSKPGSGGMSGPIGRPISPPKESHSVRAFLWTIVVILAIIMIAFLCAENGVF